MKEEIGDVGVCSRSMPINYKGAVEVFPCGGKLSDFAAVQDDVTVPTGGVARIPDRFNGSTDKEFVDWASAHYVQTMNDARVNIVTRVAAKKSRALGF